MAWGIVYMKGTVVKDELGEEVDLNRLWWDMRNSLRGSLRGNLRGNLRGSLWDSLWNNLWGSLWRGLWDSLEDRNCNGR